MPQVVYVGCKLPNGHVIAVGNKSVTLAGYNSDGFVTPEGFGVTGVDKELWDAWYKTHSEAGFAPLKAGLIFAHEKQDNLRAESADKDGLKSGFEGMPQEGEGIEPEEETAKNRKSKA